MISMELNKIYHMDALKGLRLLEANSVDLILTSPPFKDEDAGYSGEEYYHWLGWIIEECKRVSPVTIMFNSATRIVDICQMSIPDRVLVWNKNGSRASYRYEPIFVYADNNFNVKSARPTPHCNVWSDCISLPPVLKQKAPYQNPLKLYETLIRFFPETKVICDPFIGSGTTALASIRQNKDFIGFDNNPERVAMATENLKNVERPLETFSA